MTTETLWVVLGVVVTIGMVALVWSACLLRQKTRLKQQIAGLMHDKGALAMRVSVLEGLLKEKEQ